MSAITTVEYRRNNVSSGGSSTGSYDELWKIKCDTEEEAKLAYLIIRAINKGDFESLRKIKELIDSDKINAVLEEIKDQELIAQKGELKNILYNVSIYQNKSNHKDKIKETFLTAPIKLLFGIISGLAVVIIAWYFGFKVR